MKSVMDSGNVTVSWSYSSNSFAWIPLRQGSWVLLKLLFYGLRFTTLAIISMQVSVHAHDLGAGRLPAHGS